MLQIRYRQGRHLVLLLAGNTQGLPARDQHLYTRAGGKQVLQHGAGAEDALEVVQDQQELATAENALARTVTVTG